jgi:hypothetical protein
MTDERSRTKGERDWEIEDHEQDAIRRLLKRIEAVYAELDALSDVTQDQALKEIRNAIQAYMDERGE